MMNSQRRDVKKINLIEESKKIRINEGKKQALMKLLSVMKLLMTV